MPGRDPAGWGMGDVLIGERGLGCFLAGQEGGQKSGGRRWSRHTGEDFRLVRGLIVGRVGGCCRIGL